MGNIVKQPYEKVAQQKLIEDRGYSRPGQGTFLEGEHQRGTAQGQ